MKNLEPHSTPPESDIQLIHMHIKVQEALVDPYHWNPYHLQNDFVKYDYTHFINEETQVHKDLTLITKLSILGDGI